MLSEIECTDRLLADFLKSLRPVLWVGAGASIAAGYPSYRALTQTLLERAGAEGPPDASLAEIIDYVTDIVGSRTVDDILHHEIGVPKPPTDLHHAIAAFCESGVLSTIITTNYDDLIEFALRQHEVPAVVQIFEANETVSASVRVIKLHGSLSDVSNIVLSQEQYARSARYKRLQAQFDRLCTDEHLLFLGYSLQDQRLLSWLETKTDLAKSRLKLWRAILTNSEIAALRTTNFRGRPIESYYSGINLQILRVNSHSEIPDLWLRAARLCDVPVVPVPVPVNQVREIVELARTCRVVISDPRQKLQYPMTLFGENVPSLTLSPGGNIEFTRVLGRLSFELYYLHIEHLPYGNNLKTRVAESSNHVRIDITQPGTFYYHCDLRVSRGSWRALLTSRVVAVNQHKYEQWPELQRLTNSVESSR